MRAVNCFAAEDYFTRLPLPSFDNSAMDGYAVIASDCRPGKRLRVTGEQPAGLDRQLLVSTGETVRIFTGAPVPAGADAVVMQEDVVRNGDEIVVNTDVDPGEFIRRRGCDLGEGQKILGAGERISAATLALLASQGLVEVVVGGKVRVGIISTGDELARPGKKLRPGQIYESNSVLLQSLLQRCGAIAASTQYCGDNEDSLRQAFQTAAENEILIVTGGVSVGEHDLVQSVLRALGAKIDIWRVAIKPGKPFLFGRVKQTAPSPPSSPSGGGGPAFVPRGAGLRLGKREAPGEGPMPEGSTPGRRDCFVFGLPGNPVSAFVTFLRFVRPAILTMIWAGNLDLPKVQAKLAVDLINDGDRVHYIRGKAESGNFAPVGRQESHALFGLSQSNALLRLAVGESRRRGEMVEVQTWD
jgi:molybdopterin molybdotransferase